jgi:hypothetical protein
VNALAVTMLALTAALLCGCAAQNAIDSDPDAQPARTANTADQNTELALNDAVQHLQGLLRQKYGGNFGGIWRTGSADASTVTVAFTDSPQGVERLIEEHLPDDTDVVIVKHTHSEQRLRSWQNDVYKALSNSSFQDRMVYVGISYESNAVEVALSGTISAADAEDVQSLVPEAPIILSEKPPLQFVPDVVDTTTDE